MDHPSTEAQASRAELERRFASSLEDIQRISRFIARRNRLSQAETEDFCSEVNLAIIQGNYAVLSAFQGRSLFSTYLTTVIQRQFLDYRRRLWGKWRPSAEARRLGPLALRLEILLYRDGLTFEAAVETLRTNLGFQESRDDMAAIAHLLPPRTSRKAMSEGGEDMAAVPAGELMSPEAQVEGASTLARTQRLVNEVVESLAPLDRIVLRMRFENNISVADIARTLHLDQRRLYRRIEDLLARFRNSLEEAGLGWPEVVRMIERGQCQLVLPPLVSESAATRPSPKQALA